MHSVLLALRETFQTKKVIFSFFGFASSFFIMVFTLLSLVIKTPTVIYCTRVYAQD